MKETHTIDSLARLMRSMDERFSNFEATVDSLARMVAEGFSSIDKRFDAVDARFDAMDKRFDTLEGRVDTLEKEVRTTNQHIDRVMMPMLDSHASRIKNLEIRTA